MWELLLGVQPFVHNASELTDGTFVLARMQIHTRPLYLVHRHCVCVSVKVMLPKKMKVYLQNYPQISCYSAVVLCLRNIFLEIPFSSISY